jgi:hypothetical protein
MNNVRDQVIQSLDQCDPYKLDFSASILSQYRNRMVIQRMTDCSTLLVKAYNKFATFFNPKVEHPRVFRYLMLGVPGNSAKDYKKFVTDQNEKLQKLKEQADKVNKKPHDVELADQDKQSS